MSTIESLASISRNASSAYKTVATCRSSTWPFRNWRWTCLLYFKVVLLFFKRNKSVWTRHVMDPDGVFDSFFLCLEAGNILLDRDSLSFSCTDRRVQYNQGFHRVSFPSLCRHMCQTFTEKLAKVIKQFTTKDQLYYIISKFARNHTHFT